MNKDELEFIKKMPTDEMKHQAEEEITLLHELGFNYAGYSANFYVVFYAYPKAQLELAIYSFNKDSRIQVQHFDNTICEGADLAQVLKELMN